MFKPRAQSHENILYIHAVDDYRHIVTATVLLINKSVWLVPVSLADKFLPCSSLVRMGIKA